MQLGLSYQRVCSDVMCYIGRCRWEAAEKWDRWSYFRSMKDTFFKVGEDDDGYSVKVSKCAAHWTPSFNDFLQ